MTKTLVICSGGLDSVTLAWKTAKERTLTRLVTFDYGQTHRKEIGYAARAAAALGVRHDVVDIATLARFLSGSALTDPGAVDVPDGHYAEETMRVTVVPNRNAIFLSIAFGIAAAEAAEAVGIAVHGGDHFIYPDCRPPFIDAFRTMQHYALDGMWKVDLWAPFLAVDKGGIAAEGARLGVPFADTWSCYKGAERHCGRCGTCVERREAFHTAGIEDPTDYADPDYWKEAVARAAGGGGAPA